MKGTDMCTEERMKVSTVDICKCGLVMHQAEADDYDTLGAESATCCPDCGNEKFQTIQQLQAELATANKENKLLQAEIEKAVVEDFLRKFSQALKDKYEGN